MDFNISDEMGSVVRNIYTSCDPENTDSVPVESLIDFIKPYMVEDLNALENLKMALDPDKTNVTVTSKKFYEVMSDWSKKVANSSDEESDFNTTPSKLGIIDDKDLPFIQSTPRASFGEKLLKNKDLLNLSNVSTYSLSKLDNSADPDKTVLEETVKKLEYQVSKLHSEISMMKLQMSATEEQNETLQGDLERVKKRLVAEQQVIEHLQKEQTYSDELKDELSSYKKLVEELKKKLSQSEKDSQLLNDRIKKTDEAKELVEKRYETCRLECKHAKKEAFNVKMELEVIEQEMANLRTANDNFKIQLAEQTELCNHFKDENEILRHQKDTLESLKNGHSVEYSPDTQSVPLGNSPFNRSRLLRQQRSSLSPKSECFKSTPLNRMSHPDRDRRRSLAQKVLLKTSTPFGSDIQDHRAILDHSLPESVKSCPVLSPQSNSESHSIAVGYDEVNGSDMYLLSEKAENQQYESLKAEMYKADERSGYDLIIFEKEEKIYELEDEIEKLNTEIDFLQSEKERLEKEVETCQSKINKLEEIQTELMQSNFVVTGNLECANTKIQCLNNKLSEAETQIQRLKEQNNNKDTEISIFKEHVCKDNKQILADLDSTMKKNVELQSNLMDVKVELAKLKTTCSDKEKEIKELLQKNSNQILLSGTVNMKLKSTESKLEEVLKELEQKKELVENRQTQIQSLEHRLKEITEELTSKNDNIHKLQEELKLQESVVKQKENVALDTLQKLNQLKHENDEFVAKNIELQSKLDDLAKQVSVKSVELAEAINDKESLSVSNQNHEIKIKELNEKFNLTIQELQTQNNRIQVTLKNTETQLSEAKKDLAITENIKLTMSQVQQHLKDKSSIITNLQEMSNTLKVNVIQEQAKLQIKIQEVLQLKEELKRDVEIKNELWRNLNDLKKDLDVMARKNEELIQKEENLLRTSGQECTLLHNLYDEERNKSNKLNRQVEDLVEEREKLKETYERELKQNESIRNVVDSLRISFNDLERQFDEQKFVNYELSEKISLLETQRDNLQKKLEETEKSLESRKTNSISLEVHEGVVEKLNAKEKAFNTLNLNIKELHDENTSLLSKYTKEINLNSQLKQRIFEQKEEHNGLHAKQTEMANKLDMLMGEVQLLRKEKQDLSLELKESRETLETHSEASSLSLEVPKSKSFMKQQIAIDRLKEKLEHVENQLSIEKTRRSELLKSKNELDNKIVDLTNQIEMLTSENENLNLKLSTKQTRIENLIEDNKHLEILVENSDEKIRELSCVTKRAELNLQNAMVEISKKDESIESLTLTLSKLEDNIHSTTSELAIKDTNIKSLESKLKESEDKYQLAYTNCVENEKQISALKHENRQLQEAVSKSDDHKKQELMDVEEKISQARHRLELCEFDHRSLLQNIEESKKQYASVTEAQDDLRRMICDGRNDLEKHTRITFDEWKKHLDIDQIDMLKTRFCDFEKCLADASSKFEDQVALLNNQIGITSSLLNCLIPKATKMEALNLEWGEKETANYPSETKRLHKFTLKAPTLVVSRPVSPDSPCLEVEVDGNTCAKELFKKTTDDNDTKEDLCRTEGAENFRGDETEIFQQTIVCTEPTFQLSNLKIHDLFRELDSLEFDETSNPKTLLRKHDLEPYFTALAVQLAVAGKDVSERLQMQQNYYFEKLDKFQNLLINITSRLRDHICIGTNEPIVPVFVLLEELKMLVNELMQITSQLGLLSFEQRMHKPWNLIINYVTLLRQENESLSNTTSRSDGTPSSQSGLRRRMGNSKGDSITTTEHPKTRILRSPKLTLTLFAILVLFVGCIIMHWHCKANASRNQDCPLDSLISKSRVGPPPV